ncbi:SUI1 family translation initiation factor [Sessilibacter sp. MAH4]
MAKESKLVYSTEVGRVKEEPESKEAPPSDGIVRILRETKGRKGKGVSLITGIPDNHKDIAKFLKQKLGVGGAVKDFTIEMQTDDREKIKVLLESKGYIVKIAGG